MIARQTRDEVAKNARLSPNIINQIEKIQRTATPELVEAVRAGTISINAAAPSLPYRKPNKMPRLPEEKRNYNSPQDKCVQSAPGSASQKMKMQAIRVGPMQVSKALPAQETLKLSALVSK